MASGQRRVSAPESGIGRRLQHPALEPAPGSLVPVGDAALSDRQRVGVLLQAGGLIAHLDRAGWRLGRGWQGTRLTDDGVLRAVAVRPGRSRALPQEWLRELTGLLFGTADRVAGRGEARRTTRGLLAGWSQSLAPVSADELVGEILDAAPFLWEAPFGPARKALAGVHRRGASSHLWVAGPGPWRARILGAAADWGALGRLLGGERAAALWRNGGRDGGDRTAAAADPLALAAAGRFRSAIAAWAVRPPAGDRERLVCAEAWFALGRFERAHAVAAGLAGTPAAVLKLWCLLFLGRLGAARRLLRRLDADGLGGARTPAGELVALAEIALRVLTNRGDLGGARDWVARALAAAEAGGGGGGAVAARAHRLAAAAAWDRGEGAEMAGHLEAARPLADDPALGWQWRQTRALLALQGGDGGAAAADLGVALRRHRRRLRRFEAAALWNDLGVARGQAGELAGAERAFLHAQRLFRGCDGPRGTTLGLVNLAEIRLRRGRPLGVREILERVSAENRASGNVRGAAYDAALWARYELLHGRPEAALARCREALEDLDRLGLDTHREELCLLAGRALGWLGRPAEAATEIAALAAETMAQIEPEERPALWALAGDRERALAAAPAAGPAAALWRRLLVGEPAPPAAWDELAGIEPYRAARTVFDAELVAPGAAPVHWLRRAVATLRRLGAASPAARLEARDTGPWGALANYLRRPVGDRGALAALFAEAGYRDVRLWWEAADGAEVVVDGAGGEQRLAAPIAGGELVLTAPLLDPVLGALFRVALRELPPAAAAPAPARADGIVGDSPALVAALARVELLAAGELPILIHGESGTGKELVARRVHRLSPRRESPFVAINCAALSESLLLSDLFGHVRGAFTGADRDRAGVFEAAHGGTVFLDEIGDLPSTAQGMLLRVLQESEVRRVGESLPRKVDVRVVTASHRDLEAMVREGSFRQDLYYRLRGAAVTLAPLRDRGRDVVAIAEHLLAKSPVRDERGRPPRLSPTARARLLSHSWPGNVRELENVLGAAAALAAGGVLEPEHLELPVENEAPATDYHQQVESFRRRLVSEAIAAAGGNRAEAARRLGVTRQALSYLVRRLNIE